MKDKPAHLKSGANPVTFDDLKPCVLRWAHRAEVNDTVDNKIPEIRNFYKMYRPSSRTRLLPWGTDPKFIISSRGSNTGGSHKLNSAAQACAKKEGLKGHNRTGLVSGELPIHGLLLPRSRLQGVHG